MLRYYRRLMEVESTFRVLKDFLELRPVYHWTETAFGATSPSVSLLDLEALMEADLRCADLRDSDLPDQVLSPRRALRELARIRTVALDAGAHTLNVVTRHSGLQTKILAAFGVDTASWNRAHIS